MRTVGEILTEARNKKNLSLEQVEKATNIRKRVLKLLEESDWDTLAPTYTKGLLKNYASFLDLDEKKILAFFRREFDERKQPEAAKRLEVNQSKFRFTPALVTIFLVVGLVAAVFLYLLFQYRSFTAAPSLEIQEPKDNARIYSPEVNVVGRTMSDAILKINGEKVQISPGGTFSVAVSLNEGINKLTFTAENRFGKISTKTRTIIVDLPKDKVAAATSSSLLTLHLEIPNRSTFVKIDVDDKEVFQGLIMAGSVKTFTAEKKIKITSDNGGTTLVKIGDKQFFLGKTGEKVEREFTQ
ncbi:MAG: helix-turn-helix domain-containing protein [bacterium]|nr:helix-turn-helix domain-containing protein [bacterium]